LTAANNLPVDTPPFPLNTTFKYNSRRIELRELKADVAMIFGCGMIREPLYSALPHDAINMHLGLSPRYRGSATLFWPFYFMEPGYAGATFHHIISEPDAGEIIHQIVPDMQIDDGIHDIGAKTVITGAEAAVKLLKFRDEKGGWTRFKQRGTGKNFLNKDFRPEHLRVIYDIFNDDMVKAYLEGRLPRRKPKLVSQFN